MKNTLGAFAASLLLMGVAATANADFQVHYKVRGLKVAPVEPEVVVASSCLDLKTKRPDTASGVYPITVAGNTFDAFCDMVSAGGGWTMVLAQYEDDPVTDWNEGIQPDYDPSLATRRGFALNSVQLPAHSQTAFGLDHDADYVDYATFTYSTGNIAKVLVAGARASYHIHRDSVYHHGYHDPEYGTYISDGSAGAQWNQTLTFDATGGSRFTWAFSPLNSDIGSRGYSRNGLNLETVRDSGAWTVWVR